MQPQPIEYTQPVQYTQPGEVPQPSQFTQPVTQFSQPTTQFVQPAPNIMQTPQQVVYVTQQKPSSNVVPWIAVVLILLSLSMPYVSFLGESISGFEMMEYVGDMADLGSDQGDSGDSEGSGDPEDSGDLPIEYFFFGIAALMVGFGPFVFLISAIISAIVLASGNSPKAMGVIHLTYGIIFLIVAALGTIDTGILGSWSMFDFAGGGFYIGAFSSILLLIE